MHVNGADHILVVIWPEEYQAVNGSDPIWAVIWPKTWQTVSGPDLMWAVITYKYRGSFVASSINKSVEPSKELKAEQIFPQVLSTTDTTLAHLTFTLPETSMKLFCRSDFRTTLQE